MAVGSAAELRFANAVCFLRRQKICIFAGSQNAWGVPGFDSIDL
jgi:hypothetical protein